MKSEVIVVKVFVWLSLQESLQEVECGRVELHLQDVLYVRNNAEQTALEGHSHTQGGRAQKY